MKRMIDELLQMPYWIIDILPEQVPEDSEGQYFAVEKYYRDKDRLAAIKEKHINVILRLNCYRSISINGETTINPSPDHIANEMKKRFLYIMLDDAMILSEPDDTHMTLFNPDEKLLTLVKAITVGEGLFVWQPRNE